MRKITDRDDGTREIQLFKNYVLTITKCSEIAPGGLFYIHNREIIKMKALWNMEEIMGVINMNKTELKLFMDLD